MLILTAAILTMHFSGTRPAVEVKVNGQGPFFFLIDTGAAGQARIDSSLAEKLGLKPVGNVASSDAGAAAQQSLKEFRLDSLTVGDITFENVTAYSRTYNTSSYLPHLDGILGFALFEKLLLTLDYPAARVRISPGELPAPDGRTILPLKDCDGNPCAAIRIGTETVDALLDSGNSRAIDLSGSMMSRLRLITFPRTIGTGGSVSGEFSVREVQIADAIRIGNLTLRDPVVTFADPFQEVNIGSTFLRRYVITFDQQHHRVRITN
jgi:hypothetical protein